ncbi:potassium channel family protein [Halodurantibacterium flavum]|uniref:Potassium channel family protein n=1 Tax=Halodurantibacterium flavum TaxID=1382802 RepID=A0ABW4S2A0_9RHOB
MTDSVSSVEVGASPLRRLRRRLAREIDPALWPGTGLSPANRTIISLILISILLIVLETEASVFNPLREVFWWLEFTLLLVFSGEYGLRVWCAPENPRHGGRLAYMLWPLPMLDLIVIVTMAFTLVGMEGVLLRLLRLIRLLRLAKLGAFSRAFDDIAAAVFKRRFELAVSLIIAAVMLLLSSVALYVVEGGEQPVAFGSIPRAMWWSMATLTTVGYGDIVPVTAAGKVCAALTALTGIGLIAMPAGILAAAFSEAVQSRLDRERAHDRGRDRGEGPEA